MQVTKNVDGGVTIVLKNSGTECLIDILNLKERIATRLENDGLDSAPHSRFMTRLATKVEDALVDTCDDCCDSYSDDDESDDNTL